MKRSGPLKRYTSLRSNNKFNAVKINGCGSKLEAAVLDILRVREERGEISDIRQQHVVDLGCGIKWRVDFSFHDNITATRVWVEAKGVHSPRYIICKKLWKGGFGPGLLEIWKGHYTNPMRVETVVPRIKN